MSELDTFKCEIEKLGFFGMLKHAALTFILGELENRARLERGVGYGKMNIHSVSGDDVIWVAPVDIEVFWTDGGMTNGKTKYFFRTKSGREFEVTEESWLQIMHGNEYVNGKYRKPSAE